MNDTEKLARSIGSMVQQLQSEGMEIEKIATELTATAAQLGLHLQVEVVEIGGVKGLDIRHTLAREQATGDAIKPVSGCPGPHLACPACNNPEALCLNPEILKQAGTSLEDFPSEGMCPHCAARLMMVTTDGVRSFRLMTETEFLALPDWLRLNFMRNTRKIQALNKPQGRPH